MRMKVTAHMAIECKLNTFTGSRSTRKDSAVITATINLCFYVGVVSKHWDDTRNAKLYEVIVKRTISV